MLYNIIVTEVNGDYELMCVRLSFFPTVNGCWKWGEYNLPIMSSYRYLRTDFF